MRSSTKLSIVLLSTLLATAGATGCVAQTDYPPATDDEHVEPMPFPKPLPYRPAFEVLESMEGYDGSEALAISADGKTVVGRAIQDEGNAQAFAWTKAGGMKGLGILEGFSGSGARAVSADGSVIVGFAMGTGAMTGFRWTASHGMERLGGGEEISPCFASGVSADGKTVVGATSCFGGSQAYAWTKDAGLHGLGWLNPDGNPVTSEAKAVSANGKVVVGQSSFGPEGETRHAFRYTKEEGMVSLPMLPNAVDAIAWGVSANGKCVVGHSNMKSGAGIATLWRDGRAIDLGGPRDARSLTIARGVSDDCNVVVGETEGPDGNTRAFVWTSIKGMRPLSDAIADTRNAEIIDAAAPYVLVRAAAVTPDGHRIVGKAESRSGTMRGFVMTW